MTKNDYFEMLRSAECRWLTSNRIAEIVNLCEKCDRNKITLEDFEFLRVIALRFSKYLLQELRKQEESLAKEKAQTGS